MISMSDVVTMLNSKRWPHTLLLVLAVAGSSAGSTFWLTLKFASEVRTVEKMLDGRFEKIQVQLDMAWTIHMQAMRDTMVAARNTNSWIPDSYRIFEAVRSGREPTSIRLMP